MEIKPSLLFFILFFGMIQVTKLPNNEILFQAKEGDKFLVKNKVTEKERIVILIKKDCKGLYFKDLDLPKMYFFDYNIDNFLIFKIQKICL